MKLLNEAEPVLPKSAPKAKDNYELTLELHKNS